MSKFVVYTAGCGMMMRALVKRRHRDGSLSVEPYFWQTEQGRDTGTFQGGHVIRLEEAETRVCVE